MRICFPLGLAAVLLCLGLPVRAATHPGNGNTGFGGAIGNGSLTLSDNGTTVTGTLSRGSGGPFNDALVLFIDSVPGGFANTSGFADGSDGLRRAISGFDGGANRSTLTFADSFRPDYAIALGPANENFGGLWQLAFGSTLIYKTTVNLSPLGSSGAPTYTFSFNLADIGLTAGAGQSFGLFGTYISNSGYRSTEAIAGNDTGTQGWNPFVQTSSGTYTTTLVPEPSKLALFGLSGLAALFYFRTRQHS